MGDIKIFVQTKIFSRPTNPTFWAVCNRNQTIISSLPDMFAYLETLLMY